MSSRHASKQLEMARDMEERYTHRIEELLAPLVGPGRVRAQVVADVELSTTEEAREQYRPKSQIVRSEQTAEETSRNGCGTAGRAGRADESAAHTGRRIAARRRSCGDSLRRPGTGAGRAAQTRASRLGARHRTTRRSSRRATTKSIARWPTRDSRRVGSSASRWRCWSTTCARLTRTARSRRPPLTPEQVENMTRLVKDAVGFDAVARRQRQRRERLVQRRTDAEEHHARQRFRCGSGRWCAISRSCLQV